MLDIIDKNKNVVAVILDNGTVIKKDNSSDDIDELVKKKLEEMKRK